MKFREILKSETPNIITMFITLLVATLLLTFIWQDDYTINIPFGVVDKDNSSLSRSIITQLEASETLHVNFFAQSEEELEQAIKSKKINCGIIFPENFGRDVSLRKSPKALIIADGTNIMTGGTAYGAAAGVIGTISAGTEMKMLEGRGMGPSTVATNLGNFSYTERLVYDPIGNYGRRMLYTIVPLVLLQTFCVKFFLPLLIKKREAFMEAEKKDYKTHIIEIIVRTALISVASILASFVALCVMDKMHDIPMRGSIILYFVSMAAYMLNIIAFGVVCGALTIRLAHFVQIYSMGSTALVFTAGIIYPYFLIPDFLLKLIHLLCPLAPLSIELKALNLKGIGWDVAMPYIIDSLKYSFLWLAVGIVLYCLSVSRWRRKLQALREGDS